MFLPPLMSNTSNSEKAFANRDGCIFHSQKLPKGVKYDPKKIFSNIQLARKNMALNQLLRKNLITVRQKIEI